MTTKDITLYCHHDRHDDCAGKVGIAGGDARPDCTCPCHACPCWCHPEPIPNDWDGGNPPCRDCGHVITPEEIAAWRPSRRVEPCSFGTPDCDGDFDGGHMDVCPAWVTSECPCGYRAPHNEATCEFRPRDEAPTPPDPFRDLNPAQMDRIVASAWREAVTCWSDARAYTGQDATVKNALIETALSADAFWEAVRDIARQKWAAQVEDIEAAIAAD